MKQIIFNIQPDSLSQPFFDLFTSSTFQKVMEKHFGKLEISIPIINVNQEKLIINVNDSVRTPRIPSLSSVRTESIMRDLERYRGIRGMEMAVADFNTDSWSNPIAGEVQSNNIPGTIMTQEAMDRLILDAAVNLQLGGIEQ